MQIVDVSHAQNTLGDEVFVLLRIKLCKIHIPKKRLFFQCFHVLILARNIRPGNRDFGIVYT